MISLEPLIQIQKDLTPPNGRSFWTDPQEVGQAPLFTTREMALFFFGKTKMWIHYLLWDEKHVLDGELIEIPRSKAGYRLIQLHHVELIAHAFLSQGLIDLRTFRNAIMMIKAIADNYRLF